MEVLLLQAKLGRTNPEHSERIRKAWEDGKFANRKARSDDQEEDEEFFDI